VPWQRGDYYLFSKFFIRAVVPTESGLFGLYSCNERIFIGEARNLRKTLLRLHTDMLRLGFTGPTGFTFESCPDASRRARMKELFAEHESSYSEQESNNVLYG
jgi:hypothetical protein